MKYKLPQLPHIKLNKTALLVAVPVVLLLALFTLGAYEKHRQTVAQDEKTASIAEQLKVAQADVKQLKADKKTSDDKLATERLNNAQVCDWVRVTAPKYRLAVPPLCKV